MPVVTVVNQPVDTIQLHKGDLIVAPGCTLMVSYRVVTEDNGVGVGRHCLFVDLEDGIMFAGPRDRIVTRERLYDIIRGYYTANLGFGPKDIVHVSNSDYKVDITIEG